MRQTSMDVLFLAMHNMTQTYHAVVFQCIYREDIKHMYVVRFCGRYMTQKLFLCSCHKNICIEDAITCAKQLVMQAIAVVDRESAKNKKLSLASDVVIFLLTTNYPIN